MRWLVTNPHPIIAALVGAGETVVNRPGDFQVDQIGWLKAAVAGIPRTADVDPVTMGLRQMRGRPEVSHARTIDYRIDRLLRERVPDVLLLTPMDQEGLGFPLNVVNKWRSGNLKRTLVGLGQDPATYQRAKKGAWTGCSCRLHHLALYVSDDARSAQEFAKNKRAAFWRSGLPLDAVLEGVAHARSGRTWHAGRRAKPWGL